MTDADARKFLLDLLRSTGLGSYRAGDLLYATGPNTLAKLQASESSMTLHGGTQPGWSPVSMASDITGVLSAEHGGTGQAAYALGDLLYASDTLTLARLAGQITTTRKFLIQTGTGAVSAAPVWDTITSGDISGLTEAAQDAAAALIQNGTGISFVYDDAANTLTPTVTLAAFSTSNLAEGSNLYFTDERAQDAIGAALTDSSEIDFTYNDAANTISASLINDAISYAKLQNVSATNRILGRISAGAGDIEELTAANVATILAAITQSWTAQHTYTFAGVSLKIATAQARLSLSETDQAADEKNFEVLVSGKNFGIRTATDADGAGENAYLIARGTGTAIASQTWRTANTDRLTLNTTDFTSTLRVSAPSLIPTSATVPTNGLFLSAANTPAMSANSALAMSWDSSQNTLATGSLKSSSATGGVGYATGAGGAVTQATSRTTGVTLNKACGAITLVSAAGSAVFQTFTVTDSAVAATDVIHVSQKSGTDKYITHVTAVAAGSFDISFATTGGTTVEQPVFNFDVIKAVAA